MNVPSTEVTSCIAIPEVVVAENAFTHAHACMCTHTHTHTHTLELQASYLMSEDVPLEVVGASKDKNFQERHALRPLDRGTYTHVSPSAQILGGCLHPSSEKCGVL